MCELTPVTLKCTLLIVINFLPHPKCLEDFKCKDRRSCVSRTLVCDGRSHCHDGSDEVNCPPVASPSTPEQVLKCRKGLEPCKDGTECVLYSHVCDGERDCRDGSDEEDCGEFPQTNSLLEECFILHIDQRQALKVT